MSSLVDIIGNSSTQNQPILIWHESTILIQLLETMDVVSHNKEYSTRDMST